MLSADATPRQMARLRSLGADHYLGKPFDVQRLLALVDGISAARSEAAELERAFDPSIIEDLVDDDADLDAVRALVDTFLRTSAAQVAALRSAADRRDAAAVASLAHALRGGAAGLGADRVAGIARTLESDAGAGRLDRAPAAVAALSESLRSTETAMRGRFTWLGR